jgi:Metallo-beta-lactamase superfamily
MNQLVQLETAVPGLYASAPEPLPFAPSLLIRAFVLRRDHGNVWDNGEHRFLFTGDTIMLKDGEWVAAVLNSSNRESYIESLELIRELDFDVLVPWAASGDQPYHAVTSQADRRRRVGAILERIRNGEAG